METHPRSGMVDSHVHLLPDRLASAIRGFFERMGPVPFAYPLDPAEVLARHAADGIAAAWTLPYAHKPGMAATLNADVVRLAAGWALGPVDVVAGCTVHPGDPDPAGDLTAAVEAGARVLKLHCSVGAYDADDPRLAPVHRTAAALGVPVVLHVGHGVAGTTEAEELAPVARLAEAHPDTTVIIAHTAHPATDAAVELIRAHPNLYADLTPVVFQPVEVAGEVLRELPDRFLLGTDAPNTCLPASAVLDRLDDMGLPAEAWAAVTGGTARRLLGDG